MTKAVQGRDKNVAKTIEVVGWGFFFIWVGVALMTDIGWGVGLLGVGVITLGAQAVRKFVGLSIEGFWVVVGVGWCVWGILELGAIRIPGGPFPVLFIVVGIVLIMSTFWRKRVES